MAGKENLRPPKTSEEARERGRKGGKRSGEVKRERKALKEELIMLLSEGDTQKNVSIALITRALDGDTKAFEVIRDTIGEKPVDKQIIDATIMSDSDRKLLEKIENRLDRDSSKKTHK